MVTKTINFLPLISNPDASYLFSSYITVAYAPSAPLVRYEQGNFTDAGDFTFTFRSTRSADGEFRVVFNTLPFLC